MVASFDFDLRFVVTVVDVLDFVWAFDLDDIHVFVGGNDRSVNMNKLNWCNNLGFGNNINVGWFVVDGHNELFLTLSHLGLVLFNFNWVGDHSGVRSFLQFGMRWSMSTNNSLSVVNMGSSHNSWVCHNRTTNLWVGGHNSASFINDVSSLVLNVRTTDHSWLDVSMSMSTLDDSGFSDNSVATFDNSGTTFDNSWFSDNSADHTVTVSVGNVGISDTIVVRNSFHNSGDIAALDMVVWTSMSNMNFSWLSWLDMNFFVMDFLGWRVQALVVLAVEELNQHAVDWQLGQKLSSGHSLLLVDFSGQLDDVAQKLIVSLIKFNELSSMRIECLDIENTGLLVITVLDGFLQTSLKTHHTQGKDIRFVLIEQNFSVLFGDSVEKVWGHEKWSVLSDVVVHLDGEGSRGSRFHWHFQKFPGGESISSSSDIGWSDIAVGLSFLVQEVKGSEHLISDMDIDSVANWFPTGSALHEGGKIRVDEVIE